jgi:hypothetical protein
MRKHNKKIYYSAGLISIILLPIICILHLKSIDAFTHYGVMNIYIWDGKEENIGTKGITKFLNSKKYTIVDLTGDNNSDKTKLNIAEKNVRKLILTNDTISGIKFHFGEKSQYWAFIRVLDILAIEKAKFYVPYKNDIWFTNPKPRKINKNLKHIETWDCGYKPNYINESESIKWSEIKAIIEKYYLPIIAYFLMLIFTIKRIYKLNRAK